MREGIHPEYYPDAQVICGCGNTFTTGSTQKVIRTDVCSACHPFYTGEQRIVDTAGQVERFMRRMEVKEEKQREAGVAADARSKADRRARDKARQERLHRAGLREISDAMQSPGGGPRQQKAASAAGEAVGGAESEESKPRRRARRSGARRPREGEPEES